MWVPKWKGKLVNFGKAINDSSITKGPQIGLIFYSFFKGNCIKKMLYMVLQHFERKKFILFHFLKEFERLSRAK